MELEMEPMTRKRRAVGVGDETFVRARGADGAPDL